MLSLLAVQWHIVAAEKLSNSGMSLLLRNSQGGPLSPWAVQWHVTAAEKLSTAQGGLLSPLAVQWNVVPADNCSRRAALSTGCSVACRSNYTSAYFMMISFVYLFMLSNAVVIILRLSLASHLH